MFSDSLEGNVGNARGRSDLADVQEEAAIDTTNTVSAPHIGEHAHCRLARVKVRLEASAREYERVDDQVTDARRE